MRDTFNVCLLTVKLYLSRLRASFHKLIFRKTYQRCVAAAKHSPDKERCEMLTTACRGKFACEKVSSQSAFPRTGPEQ